MEYNWIIIILSIYLCPSINYFIIIIYFILYSSVRLRAFATLYRSSSNLLRSIMMSTVLWWWGSVDGVRFSFRVTAGWIKVCGSVDISLMNPHLHHTGTLLIAQHNIHPVTHPRELQSHIYIIYQISPSRVLIFGDISKQSTVKLNCYMISF